MDRRKKYEKTRYRKFVSFNEKEKALKEFANSMKPSFSEKVKEWLESEMKKRNWK